MTVFKNKRSYQILFQWGIVILPILEIYRSFFGDTIQLGFLALEEALLLVWAGTLFGAGVVFSFLEKRKKALILTGGYCLLFFVYLILHAWNASRFDSSLLPGASPSLIREAYYTLRMYLAPLCLVLGAILLKMPKKRILTGILGAAWVISLSIVFTDLLGISFASYADGNQVVSGGFFSWFTLPDNADFALFTAKGPFHSANDMGAVLFGLTPFVAFSALKRGKILDYLLLAFTGLAAVMVGTKIGSYGFGMVLVGMIILALYDLLFSKGEKKDWKKLILPALIFGLYIPLLLLSPGKRLQDVRNAQAQDSFRPTENAGQVSQVTEKDTESSFTPEDTQHLESYLKEHYWDHFIDPWFLELYPVSGDVEFWAKVTGRPNTENGDSRDFKVEMIQRIAQRNDRSLDKLLGIGHTSGVPYAERDYLFQFYLFGWAGLLVLFLPFVALLFWNGKDLILSLFSRKPLLLSAATFLSLVAYFATAWFSGHVFDTQFTTYFLCVSGAALMAEKNHEV